MNLKKILIFSFLVLLPYLFREEAKALSKYDRQVWKVAEPSTTSINGVDEVVTEWRLAGDFKIGTSTADADIHTIFRSTSGIELNDAGIVISTSAGQTNIGIKFPDNSLMTTANIGSANSLQSNTNVDINADADGDASGEIRFQINGGTKVYIDNSGETTFTNGINLRFGTPNKQWINTDYSNFTVDELLFQNFRIWKQFGQPDAMKLQLPEGHLVLTGTMTATTVNTGQGNNELYDMDQNVTTTSNVIFNNITVNGNLDTQNTRFQLIYSTDIVSAVTNISITGLDSDIDVTYYLQVEKSSSSPTSTYYLYVNGDTTATNYYSQSLFSSGATTSSSRSNTPAILFSSLGTVGFANVDASRIGNYFAFKSQTARNSGGTAPDLQLYSGGKNGTITKITQLDITASVASGIGVDSRIRLYGLR